MLLLVCRLVITPPFSSSFNSTYRSASFLLAKRSRYFYDNEAIKEDSVYPNDNRPGHLEGRLKRIFHVNPVAFVIEQAGGMATDGRVRLLDQAAERMDQRAPLIFGTPSEVERVRRYYDLPMGGMRSPLFSHRGLFR